MENINTISHSKTKNIVMCGLLAAIICLTTAYIFHIPLGGNNGYVHIGDAFIFLAAAILPTPYAIACAVIGAGLADIVTGAAVWFIPTVIIKSILVLCISSKKEKIVNTRNILGAAVAGILGVVLYMVAEGIIFGSFTSAFVFSLLGLLQPIGSLAVFIVLGLAFDKINMKKRI